MCVVVFLVITKWLGSVPCTDNIIGDSTLLFEGGSVEPRG